MGDYGGVFGGDGARRVFGERDFGGVRGIDGGVYGGWGDVSVVGGVVVCYCVCVGVEE